MVILLFGLWLAPLSAVRAGTISLQTQISIRKSADLWIASVTVSNAGDEAAHHVRANVQLWSGQPKNRAVRDPLFPGESRSVSLSFRQQLPKPGRYPLFVWVDYTDANQYPFSAISMAAVQNKEASSPALFAISKNIEMASEGRLELKIKNLSAEPKKLDISFFLPKELSAEKILSPPNLAPNEEKRITHPLRNFSALAGSTYPIFAVIQYETPQEQFLLTAPAQVRIVERQKGLLRPFTGALIILAILLLWAISHRLKK